MAVCQTLSTDYRKSQEELASNYALQVALQTMKERCQQLQSRLSMVEDENLQLKIDKQRHTRQENKMNRISLDDVDKLQEQIAQLSRQKSQLTHHIYMVATENKHLWTRLSLLTEANESLGTRLNKISSALSNHTNKTDQFLNDINKDLGNQSLEEISLKLVNNIQQEKIKLEQQYVEMAELQSFKDCDFTLIKTEDPENTQICDVHEEDDSYEISNDLKSCKQQMLTFLSIVKSQRETLQECIKLLKQYTKGTEHCLICKKHLEQTKKIYCDAKVMTSLSEIVEKDSIDEEIQNINRNSEELGECPMGCNYSNSIREKLAEHVLTHFPPIKYEDYEYVEQTPSLNLII